MSRRRDLHSYCLYGLRFRSQWPLPFPEETGSCLAEVKLFEGPATLFAEALKEVPPKGSESFQHVRLRDGSNYLRWPGLFEFVISADGSRIACRPLQDASPEVFHAYLLGQVLSFAMLLQGIEPLHSTTVVIDGKAVGFMGDCGYGKSSLAATFLLAGHPLLTDDLLILKGEGLGFSAYPGPPRIKLLSKTARSLLGEGVRGIPMNGMGRKLIIPLNRHRSSRASAPLKAIYVLQHPAAASRYKRVSIRRLPQRRAFLELLKNTYNNILIDADRLKHQFLQAAKLASVVPIKLLSYPRRLTFLPTVRKAILSDLLE